MGNTSTHPFFIRRTSADLISGENGTDAKIPIFKDFFKVFIKRIHKTRSIGFLGLSLL
jgi:hypothetical protein